jgi:nitrogen fixation/metabolism regulation signal transduction histidine kinase
MHGYEGSSDRAADYHSRSRTPEDGVRPYERFARSVLDSLSAHVAVFDASGTIVAANGTWKAFAEANGADPRMVSEGANYLGRVIRCLGQRRRGPPSSRPG